MADMDIQPKYVPPCCIGLSRGVRPPHKLQAASFKESCKSSVACSSASATSMHFGPHMAGEAQLLKGGKNHASAEPRRLEGAGGLLLLAAANETGLLSQMETAIAPCSPPEHASLLSCSTRCRRQLLLTLLFLNGCGLHRTRDLRRYTGDALGLLTGRSRAYGYFHTERFLSQLARADGAEALTTALGVWTARLWEVGAQDAEEEIPPCFYIDGHRKPVYADCLLPRGLIGCSGKILGCRALVLLHDEQGHPHLATTARGDQHLTTGLPKALARYEQVGGKVAHARIIVDREGMAAAFLRDLAQAGQTVVTLLRTDQYSGLESFSNVGTFVPLTHDRDGQVVREVAPACFTLPLPDQAGQSLLLQVAASPRSTSSGCLLPARERTGARWACACLVVRWLASRADPGEACECEVDPHRDDRGEYRCHGTGSDLHSTLASSRKRDPRLSFASWTRHQPWLWQDAGHQFRGEQETSSLAEAVEFHQTVGFGGSGSFSSGFFALYTAMARKLRPKEKSAIGSWISSGKPSKCKGFPQDKGKPNAIGSRLRLRARWQSCGNASIES